MFLYYFFYLIERTRMKLPLARLVAFVNNIPRIRSFEVLKSIQYILSNINMEMFSSAMSMTVKRHTFISIFLTAEK